MSKELQPLSQPALTTQFSQLALPVRSHSLLSHWRSHLTPQVSHRRRRLTLAQPSQSSLSQPALTPSVSQRSSHSSLSQLALTSAKPSHTAALTPSVSQRSSHSSLSQLALTLAQPSHISFSCLTSPQASHFNNFLDKFPQKMICAL